MAFVSSTLQCNLVVSGNIVSLTMNIDELRFPDDFDEFKARAESGGSTYGLLRRQATAQRSLYAGTSRLTTLTTERENGNGSTIKPGQKTSARRSKSLVPPSKPSYVCDDYHDIRNAQNDVSGSSPVDPKVIFKTFCEKAQLQQQQQHQQQKMDTLKVPGFDFRRHSMKEDRLRHAYVSALDPDLLPGSAHVLTSTSSTCRRRSFSVTPKGGLVNEGDELLVAQSTAAETAITMTIQDSASAVCAASLNISQAPTDRRYSTQSVGVAAVDSDDDSATYRVMVLGGPGVGKTAITQQFLTSEYMAAQNTSFDDGREISVPVMLNGSESVMDFIDLPYSGDPDEWRGHQVDGFIVVYSITDRRSYQKACDLLDNIRELDKTRRGVEFNVANKPIVLVANKSDLERSRMIGKEEGKSLAQNHASKYIEVSAILNHKIDDLLVGILKQIRSTHELATSSPQSKWTHQHKGHQRHGSKDMPRNEHQVMINCSTTAHRQKSVHQVHHDDEDCFSDDLGKSFGADGVSLCSSTTGDGISCRPLTTGCLSKYGGMFARLRRVGSPKRSRRSTEGEEQTTNSAATKPSRGIGDSIT